MSRTTRQNVRTFSKDNIAVQNPEIINDLMQRLSKVSFLQAAHKIYKYLYSFIRFLGESMARQSAYGFI